MSAGELLRIEKAVYGGDGLAHTPSGEVAFVPFVLPGELVQPENSASAPEILEPSRDRVPPRCVHFGACGGCQYQMAGYGAQLGLKQAILNETLSRAGLHDLPETQILPSPHPWEYRNRIRLRVRRLDGMLHLGYSVRGTRDFLPIAMCPIAAPLLVRAAGMLVELASSQPNPNAWLGAANEVELFCDNDGIRLQLHLLCAGKLPSPQSSFDRFATALQRHLGELTGAGASRLDPRSGLARETLAAWGADGLTYSVGAENHWITRGSFFQVNRFLLPAMVELVCAGRHGSRAWDLFAGLGLFSRVLARNFEAVTAVEANPTALVSLRSALARLGSQHRAVQSTTLDFLRRAVLERDRPELIVLDPPRAGAGTEACTLLARLAPAQIVYVSCDPTTLARDLQTLTAAYTVTSVILLDLFPQTYHLETVISLQRKA